MIASVTFPPGIGQFMAADINTHDQVSIIKGKTNRGLKGKMSVSCLAW